MRHCIGSWHTDLHVDTLEAAPGVVTLRAGCGAGCRLPGLRALVHVLARPPVGGEAVARGAGAAEGAGLVVALALALARALALVLVLAGAPVLGQRVALAAVAAVGAPQVGALVAADVGDLGTLVNVHTRAAAVLEPRLADTSTSTRR